MVVGLTGGIGSGKTTVAKLFETMGCLVYYSDDKARDIYFNDAVRLQVTALLGEAAYSGNSLNREYISGKIFSDKALLEKLNAIIHPAVKADFEAFTQQFPHRMILKESALIFELGLYKTLDATILVTAPVAQKIKRVMARNGLGEAEVHKRMQTQWADEQKLPLATYVMQNADGEALIPQALEILKQLKARAKA